MQHYFNFILFFIGLFVTYVSLPYFKNMLVIGGIVRPNYRNEIIPVSMGLVFIPSIVINSIFFIVFLKGSYDLSFLFLYVLGLVLMSFAGFIDDLVGDREYSGLKGHFKALLSGTLTTGAFKALLGGFIGILISVFVSSSLIDIAINSLIIALSTNFMNLLDLRPGRAIKGYLLITIILFTFTTWETQSLILLLLPAVLVYFKTDLKALSMMGDTGSNILGISIGILIVYSCGLLTKLCWFLFLISIHLLTEKYSLTKIIESNKILNSLDSFGR